MVKNIRPLPVEADTSVSDEPLADVRSIYAGEVQHGLAISTFRNTERLFPSNIVACAESPTAIKSNPVSLYGIQFQSRGSIYGLQDYVSLNRVAGLMVLKDGKAALEEHYLGNNELTRWMSMSVAKSISSTLVGAAIQDGLIGGVQDLLTEYLPELINSGYEQVSVKHLLQMTSGVRWDDSPTNPDSERRKMLELQIAQQPGTIMNYMSSLPSLAKPGTTWNYSTGETHVMGALIRAATGRSVAKFLSEKIWSRIGTERDATWWLDALDGLEVAGSGMSATLRDYARFGQFILNDGVIDGERVLPVHWMAESGSPREIGGKMVNYGYMWWPVSAGSENVGAFSARGLFGQYIYINPIEKVVIVALSARSKPLYAEVVEDNDFFNAVVEALK
jgi:CubicO group peptidase (beta-lactamase class C family)